MKIIINNNTVYAFATQRNATQRNATQQHNFKFFKKQSHNKFNKLFFNSLSVSFGYFNFDNLSGENKPDFVINKNFSYKEIIKWKALKNLL